MNIACSPPTPSSPIYLYKLTTILLKFGVALLEHIRLSDYGHSLGVYVIKGVRPLAGTVQIHVTPEGYIHTDFLFSLTIALNSCRICISIWIDIIPAVFYKAFNLNWYSIISFIQNAKGKITIIFWKKWTRPNIKEKGRKKETSKMYLRCV